MDMSEEQSVKKEFRRSSYVSCLWKRSTNLDLFVDEDFAMLVRVNGVSRAVLSPEVFGGHPEWDLYTSLDEMPARRAAHGEQQ